jgi:hypothetical protein
MPSLRIGDLGSRCTPVRQWVGVEWRSCAIDTRRGETDEARTPGQAQCAPERQRERSVVVKKIGYEALSAAAGLLAAVAARKLVSAVWRGDAEPPLNPADRRVSWRDALSWALASALGAAVARVVALRGTAAGWERATGEVPPGLQTS